MKIIKKKRLGINVICNLGPKRMVYKVVGQLAKIKQGL